MAFIEWKEELSVGIPEMDAQHKRLVELTNRLYEAMRTGDGGTVLKTILNELVTYTKVHFVAEERMMESRRHPELAAHKQLHQHFTRNVTEMNEKIQAGKMVNTVVVGSFLKDWLVRHIQQEDRKYSPHACAVTC